MSATIAWVLWLSSRSRGGQYWIEWSRDQSNNKPKAIDVCHESRVCYISDCRSVLYTRIVHVHTLCLPSFPPWCSAYSYGKQKCATCQARFARKKRKKKDMMPPPHLELCTTVIRCTVIRVWVFSFFLFFYDCEASETTERERERERNKAKRDTLING